MDQEKDLDAFAKEEDMCHIIKQIMKSVIRCMTEPRRD